MWRGEVKQQWEIRFPSANDLDHFVPSKNAPHVKSRGCVTNVIFPKRAINNKLNTRLADVV